MNLPVPSELHAIIVHFPIALAIVGVPLVIAVACSAADRLALRWASVVLYIVVAAGAYTAFWSGERARAAIPNHYPQQIWDILETHEGLAATVWIGALITAVFLLIGAINLAWVRVPATTIAFVASIITAVLVGITAHFGGQLVYRHAVGTPGAAAIYGAPALRMAGSAAPPAVSPPESDLFNVLQPAETIVVAPNTGTLAPGPRVARDPMAGTIDSVAASATEDVTAPAVASADEAETPVTALAPVAEPEVSVRPIDPAAAQSVSYTRQVAPILDLYCYDCHYDGEAEGDLLLTSVEDMLIGGEKAGPAVIPGEPDNSPMIQYIRGILKPRMPKRQPPLSEDEVHILRSWIHAGAVDDSAP